MNLEIYMAKAETSPVEAYSISTEMDKFLEYREVRNSTFSPGYPSFPGPTAASIRTEDGKILGNCNRQTWYRIQGAKLGIVGKPFDARALKIFKYGKMIEDMAKDYLKEMGIYETSGIRFYLPDMLVKGELDFVVNIPDVGKFIIENKSYYGYTTNKKIRGYKARSGKIVPPEPKLDNALQTFMYAYVFRPNNEYGFTPLDGAKILYWSRDELRTDDFDIRVHEQDNNWYAKISGVVDTRIHINGIKERYADLWNYLSPTTNPDMTPPPQDFTPIPTDAEIEELHSSGDIGETVYESFLTKPTDFNRMRCAPFQCSYCGFRDQCVVDKETEVC